VGEVRSVKGPKPQVSGRSESIRSGGPSSSRRSRSAGSGAGAARPPTGTSTPTRSARSRIAGQRGCGDREGGNETAMTFDE